MVRFARKSALAKGLPLACHGIERDLARLLNKRLSAGGGEGRPAVVDFFLNA